MSHHVHSVLPHVACSLDSLGCRQAHWRLPHAAAGCTLPRLILPVGACSLLRQDACFPSSGSLLLNSNTAPTCACAMLQLVHAAAWVIPDGVEVSKSCEDLLSRIFVIEPEHRITLAGIQRHPWFRRNLPREEGAAREPPRRSCWLCFCGVRAQLPLAGMACLQCSASVCLWGLARGIQSVMWAAGPTCQKLPQCGMPWSILRPAGMVGL